MSQTYYNYATGQYEPWTRRMHTNRPYREAILSGEFRPSSYALEVDRIMDRDRAATENNKEAHPEYWTWLGMMGWVFTHPLASQNSMTEHTGWVNRGLGRSFFGAGSSARGTFKDIYDDPDPADNNEYMTQAELDAYNQANGTNFSGNYLRLHPDTGEAGLWTWDPQAGWRDDTKWTGTTTGPNFSADNPNAPDNNVGGNNNGGNNAPAEEEKPIGWYWSGSAWLPFYQGEAPPAGLAQGWVAPTSTMPSSPPQSANTGGTDPDPTNTDGTNTDSTDTGGTNPEPPPPSLFTPDGSMFFQGLFNASDLLYRDGNTVTSPYYNNARQDILDQLSVQAAANGRTQNTAEEIQMAQNQTPSLSATGLFNPDYFTLLKGMGVG